MDPEEFSTQAPLAEGRVGVIHPWSEGRVIKLARDWVPAEWMQHEYEIAKAVHATGLNVPEAFGIEEVDGRAGIVYERVRGPTMLDRLGSVPHKAAALGKQLGALHAEMHTRKAADSLPDNHARLRRKIESVEGAPESLKKAALADLEALPSGSALLHGDFHPGNVLLADQGPVSIDWPDASAGHPLGDVARTMILIGIGGVPPKPILAVLVGLLRRSFRAAYLRRYFTASPYSRDEVDAWLFPVLFARLSENIESERKATKRWLRQLQPKRFKNI